MFPVFYLTFFLEYHHATQTVLKLLVCLGLPSTGIKATTLHTPLVLSLNHFLNLAHRACWCFLRRLKKRALKYQSFQFLLKELGTVSFSKRKDKSLSLIKKVDLHSKHVCCTPSATASFTHETSLGIWPFCSLVAWKVCSCPGDLL